MMNTTWKGGDKEQSNWKHTHSRLFGIQQINGKSRRAAVPSEAANAGMWVCGVVYSPSQRQVNRSTEHTQLDEDTRGRVEERRQYNPLSVQFTTISSCIVFATSVGPSESLSKKTTSKITAAPLPPPRGLFSEPLCVANLPHNRKWMTDADRGRFALISSSGVLFCPFLAPSEDYIEGSLPLLPLFGAAQISICWIIWAERSLKVLFLD